jgi:hypothetical protein
MNAAAYARLEAVKSGKVTIAAVTSDITGKRLS